MVVGTDKKMVRITYDWKQILIVGVIVACLLVVWDSPVVYILKLFVVLMHEISHGLGAIFTGGSIDYISLGSNESGEATTSNGNLLVIISAGYVGSFLWGVILLLSSKSKLMSKVVTMLLDLLILGTLLFMNTQFGLVYGTLLGLGLIAIGFWLNGLVLSYFLKVLGVLTCLYVILDIKSDLFFSKGINDAIILESITGIPALVFTILWIILIAITFWLCIAIKIEFKPKSTKWRD